MTINERVIPFDRATATIEIFSGWRIGRKDYSLSDFGQPIFANNDVGKNFCRDYIRIFRGEKLFPEGSCPGQSPREEVVVGQVTDTTLKEIILLSMKVDRAIKEVDKYPTWPEEVFAFRQKPPLEHSRFVEARNRLFTMKTMIRKTTIAGVIHNLGKENQLEEAADIASNYPHRMNFFIGDGWNIMLVPA